jgi:hypothetical protein
MSSESQQQIKRPRKMLINRAYLKRYLNFKLNAEYKLASSAFQYLDERLKLEILSLVKKAGSLLSYSDKKMIGSRELKLIVQNLNQN